jgi:hypothetical protein
MRPPDERVRCAGLLKGVVDVVPAVRISRKTGYKWVDGIVPIPESGSWTLACVAPLSVGDAAELA